MKRALILVVFGLLGLALLACQPETPMPLLTPTPTVGLSPTPSRVVVVASSTPTVFLTPTPTPDLGLNLVVEVKGQVVHKRPGWRDSLPVLFGTSLQQDDLLQAGTDGQALVVCADLTLGKVSSGYWGGLYGQICPTATPVLMRDESKVIGPRRPAPLPAPIPYILSPRRTRVMTTYPLLKWHPVPNVNRYAVTVRGKDGEWMTETTDTELVYPPSAPTLVPGTLYTLIVRDDQAHSSEDEDIFLDLGFELLPPEETAAVELLEAQIRDLPLDEIAIRFLVGELYASRGLTADAIAAFEALGADFNEPAIDRRLGDLYLEVGLYEEALAAYKQALAGSQAIGDREGEAAALTGMGRSYWRDGNSADVAEARRRLEQAIKMYNLIGDTERAGDLETEIMKLPK